MMNKVQEVYQVMPYGTILNKKVFIVHGGLSQYDDCTIDEIEK